MNQNKTAIVIVIAALIVTGTYMWMARAAGIDPHELATCSQYLTL